MAEGSARDSVPLVLAADANREILELMGYLLADDGYRYELQLIDGDVTARVRELRPATVVLGLPPWEDERSRLLDQLTACPVSATTPLILLSWGTHELEEKRYGGRLRVAGTLYKSFDVDEVSAMLRTATATSAFA